jgi:hypothetical protein
MAINLRQFKTELSLTNERLNEALKNLGIDSSNYGRTLSQQEESRLRQFFSGGQSAPQQPTPGEVAAAQEPTQFLNHLTDVAATGLAAQYTPMTIAKTLQKISTQSSATSAAQFQQLTGTTVSDRDWFSDAQAAMIAPLAQGFNVAVEAFSLMPLSLPSSALTPSLPPSPSSIEASDESDLPVESNESASTTAVS